MTKLSVPAEELLRGGHQACQGCGSALAMRLALKALGSETVFVVPACCWTVIAGGWPQSSLEVSVLHAPFASAAATASGVKAGLLARGDEKTRVVVWGGDGGTYDIGLQSLSGAADRGDDIIYVCYDNEAYMNTGIQRSGSTPLGAWTTTTPSGSAVGKKDVDAIVEAHRPAYMASATVSHAEDFVRKFAKARAAKGFRFLHVLAPCPPGWKHESDRTVELARLAVQTGAFPLWELEDGSFRLSYAPKALKPLNEFLDGQGRFAKLPEPRREALESWVSERWKRLLARHQAGR